MDWDAIKRLDYQWIHSIWMEARAELLYEAFLNSRDLTEWAHYLEANPPSPETLAIALMLGSEKYEERKKAMLAKAGANGAKVKHSPTHALKAWAAREAASMRGAEKEIARRLASRIPKELADASRDPQRLIYDHLRELRKPAKPASQP